ncbi:hypothetical protein [Methanocella arvoryzae]|uniref:Uncharacterized protein n=1 Tax=Methanocella arvoryzae (strain DSM 22066 / NBRC 105507 / MRE50) TaxID=351160 RepID=Q0W8B5_METAR|nr:hypothetical protein [Methanocella arvoryzae]CAJ35378.1 hypothetical protein LRC419 [Methanocella arvoryzae MRE50]
MKLSDEELVRLVLDDEDFKNAASINEVKGVVRRVLRKRLIDMHINDSSEVSVRQCMVNRHLEWITLKILLDVDGILVIPDHLDDLEYFKMAREQKYQNNSG